ARHGLYDVEVINPNGDTAFAPYRYLVEPALPPDVRIGLGGPRVLFAGDTAHYGFSLASASNVDVPYVYFEYGVPALPLNEDKPRLGFNTDAGSQPSVGNVPWPSLSPVVDQGGELVAPGYALDLADGSSTTIGFSAQTYPNGLPNDALETPPSDT